ncbi:MAG: NAD-dependent deacylase [Weeksellaceae bacterium]|nr:NAD-dependent deacylase [Weeksellaceae bacterium]
MTEAKDKPKMVVLTGAGVSQESGISTFRDSDGLWENHDIMEVASPEGFRDNPELVLKFYNARRNQLSSVEPNQAHHFLKELEQCYDVTIITQNVDDLHERAGSSNIIHLHGELTKMRSVHDEEVTYPYDKDIAVGDLAPDGGQLRPHIVWFGEMVPAMDAALEATRQADFFLVIGTSLQVYPAAGLVNYVPHGKPVVVVDPDDLSLPSSIHHIRMPATAACAVLRKSLLSGQQESEEE